MSTNLILAMSCIATAGLAGGGTYYFLTTTAPHASAAASEAPPETLGVVELAPFVTNINDPSGRRHARVEVKLVVSPEDRAKAISSDALAIARLRDRAILLVASKTVDELTRPAGKAALRDQILEEAVPIVAPGAVKEALFSDIVVQ